MPPTCDAARIRAAQQPGARAPYLTSGRPSAVHHHRIQFRRSARRRNQLRKGDQRERE